MKTYILGCLGACGLAASLGAQTPGQQTLPPGIELNFPAPPVTEDPLGESLFIPRSPNLPDSLPTYGEDPEGPGITRLPNNIEELLRRNPGLFAPGSRGGIPFQREVQGAPLEEQEATVQKALGDLQSKDSEIRRSACMILGKYGLPNAREGLLGAVSDPVANVRRTALVSLLENRSQLVGREALEVLPMVADEDVHNRRLATSSLQLMMFTLSFQQRAGSSAPIRSFPPALAAKLKSALLDSDLTVRRNMVAGLTNLRIELDVPTVTKLLQDSDREIRLGTMTALSQLQPDLIGRLGKLLINDPENLVREELVNLLARFPTQEAHELLQKLAGDSSVKVAVLAKLTLFQMAPSLETYKEMLPLLDQPGLGVDVLRPIVYSAASLPPEEAKTILEGILKKRSPIYTADALAMYSSVVAAVDQPNLEAVLPFLDDPSQTIRQAALSVLMRAPGAVTSERIDKLATSPHADVREQALFFSHLLPEEKAADLAMELLLDDNVNVRISALSDLVTRKVPNWPLLVEQSLKDDNQNMSQAALETLANEPSPQGLKILQGFLAKNPTHPLVPAATNQLYYIQEQLKQQSTRQPAN